MRREKKIMEGRRALASLILMAFAVGCHCLSINSNDCGDPDIKRALAQIVLNEGSKQKASHNAFWITKNHIMTHWISHKGEDLTYKAMVGGIEYPVSYVGKCGQGRFQQAIFKVDSAPTSSITPICLDALEGRNNIKGTIVSLTEPGMEGKYKEAGVTCTSGTGSEATCTWKNNQLTQLLGSPIITEDGNKRKAVAAFAYSSNQPGSNTFHALQFSVGVQQCIHSYLNPFLVAQLTQLVIYEKKKYRPKKVHAIHNAFWVTNNHLMAHWISHKGDGEGFTYKANFRGKEYLASYLGMCGQGYLEQVIFRVDANPNHIPLMMKDEFKGNTKAIQARIISLTEPGNKGMSQETDVTCTSGTGPKATCTWKNNHLTQPLGSPIIGKGGKVIAAFAYSSTDSSKPNDFYALKFTDGIQRCVRGWANA